MNLFWHISHVFVEWAKEVSSESNWKGEAGLIKILTSQKKKDYCCGYIWLCIKSQIKDLNTNFIIMFSIYNCWFMVGECWPPPPPRNWNSTTPVYPSLYKGVIYITETFNLCIKQIFLISRLIFHISIKIFKIKNTN